MNKRILFVDDESLVLRGLERSLRSMRAEWDIEFADSGPAALATMERHPFDVVITDMRMPGMNGAQLLDQVKRMFPQTVRMILSGQSDKETILRSIGPTHQYLAKPCDVEDLKQKLTHAFALRDLLSDPRLKEVVSQLHVVPSLPQLYLAITDLVRSPEASITEAGNIIAQDMGMCVKVLQLVNSAFFGLATPVSNPRQAAALIGIDNIKALVLSVHVFSQFEGLSADLSFLWKHSLSAAGCAKAIARQQDAKRALVDDCFTAGLLHDIGKLILVSVYPEESTRIWQDCAQNGDSVLTNEQQALGCTHAAVGAYLLGLWGLPDPIVEAVAWHHRPADAPTPKFGPLIATHVANYFDHQMNSYPVASKPALDENLLANLGLGKYVEAWGHICRELHSQSEKHE